MTAPENGAVTVALILIREPGSGARRSGERRTCAWLSAFASSHTCPVTWPPRTPEPTPVTPAAVTSIDRRASVVDA